MTTTSLVIALATLSAACIIITIALALHIGRAESRMSEQGRMITSIVGDMDTLISATELHKKED